MLSRCSTARGSSSGLSQGGLTKVKVCKSFLFTEGSPKVENKEHYFFNVGSPSGLLPLYWPSKICISYFNAIFLYYNNIVRWRRMSNLKSVIQIPPSSCHYCFSVFQLLDESYMLPMLWWECWNACAFGCYAVAKWHSQLLHNKLLVKNISGEK